MLREVGLILGFIKQHVPGEEKFFCLRFKTLVCILSW